MDVDVTIRNENRRDAGQITTFESLQLLQRRCDAGRWTLVTKNPRDAGALWPKMDSEGKITANRGVILRRSDGYLASGWQDRPPTVVNDGKTTTWTFQGWDDTYLMYRALCYPLPTAPVTAQTDAHHVVTGSASERIREYFRANVVARRAIPGADAGATTAIGPAGETQLRFDRLLTAAQVIAGRELNFRVVQRGASLVLEQWAPVDKRSSIVFAPEAGTVTGWSFEPTESKANTVVVGAGGEMALRGFREYSDSDDSDAWGPIEEFKDRRDLSLENPDWFLVAEADARQFLAESVSRNTFKITLKGSPKRRYGIDFIVGDRVRAYIDTDDDGQPVGLVDDLVEEATTTWSSAGEVCNVVIGSANNPQNPVQWLSQRLLLAMDRIRQLEAGR